MENFLKKTPLKRFKLKDFTYRYFLGKGASGSVYKHSQNDVIYAVKVLNKGGWEEEDFYEDLLWQTEIIKHMGELKNSVNFFGFDVVQMDNVKTIALVMEYFDHNDLYEYINSKKYWSKLYENKGYCFKKGKTFNVYTMLKLEKLNISKGILEAVKEIHSKGIDVVHSDIKTANIIMVEPLCIKLIDFGAAIFSEDNDGLCRTDWNHGTIGYASPEDTQNYLLGKSSDIYSLGVSLIEVWSGFIWDKSDDFQGCRCEVLKSLRLIEKNDKEIGKILRKMINKNSSKRPKIDKVIEYFDAVKCN